jgi:hypothetical protein
VKQSPHHINIMSPIGYSVNSDDLVNPHVCLLVTLREQGITYSPTRYIFKRQALVYHGDLDLVAGGGVALACLESSLIIGHALGNGDSSQESFHFRSGEGGKDGLIIQGI